MLDNGSERRNRHKVEFLKKHKNFARTAFREAIRLREKGEDIRKSEPVTQLINMARIDLKYSPKTYSLDIFWGLAKTSHGLLEGEENG
ncbi:MAG TPA: hypothetical protein VMV86_04380 [Methanosarcinales archaeon]|nr:hypothetical protein [Methanosarcinales archaeon]